MDELSGPAGFFFNCRFFLRGGPIFTGSAATGSFLVSSSSSGADSSVSSTAFRFLGETAEVDFRRGDLGLDAAAFPRADFLVKERTVCLGARPRLGGGGEGEGSVSCSSSRMRSTSDSSPCCEDTASDSSASGEDSRLDLRLAPVEALLARAR